MTNLDSIFKSRDITLRTKVHVGKAMFFPKDFIVLGLMFRFLIHFEFIFVYIKDAYSLEEKV